ncbi:MAG: Ribonuclease HI [Candidatus Woesebacteria bacterium GW2011_GWB1_45_5]|uniref:Ribonuclease HI n=1 Tax=Candidatus Woesebacteria bacterium GW2011_GWB1_45_5 TaxID=1618581 RepID=A0A0G1PWX3_9BACT|nr:MAG: Ribonuclease HI [Candidatus Woesebacteria bacterium GW2011_GWB1_45_5]
MNEGVLVIHTDGGARGNPGPSACAFVAEKAGKLIFKDSKYLGITTNNQAEYQGAILALKWFTGTDTGLHISTVEFYLDSELIVRQLNGVYKVKDKDLRQLFFEASSLIKSIPLKIIFKNIPRSKNKLADLLVNQELDRQH